MSGAKARHDRDGLNTAALIVFGPLLQDPIGPLSAAEKKDLKRLEYAILKCHREGSEALKEISERRLYRETHQTFTAYVAERWGFSKSEAYRQIQEVKVREIVSPIGDKMQLDLKPSHLRPLSNPKLESAADYSDVLKLAVKSAATDARGRPQLTAKLVSAAVRQYITPQDEPEAGSRRRVVPLIESVGGAAPPNYVHAIANLRGAVSAFVRQAAGDLEYLGAICETLEELRAQIILDTQASENAEMAHQQPTAARRSKKPR